MDREIKDYFEQKFLVFTTKDDIEKLRQEMKANLLKFKEEVKNHILDSINETKRMVETSELKRKLEEVREDFKGWQKDIELNLNSAISESSFAISKIEKEKESLVKQFQEEVEPRFKTLKDEIIDSLNMVNLKLHSYIEEGQENAFKSIKALEPQINELKKDIESIKNQTNKVIGEIGTFYDKMIRELKEMKDEVGYMVKLSYRDFERRLEALEQRVKAIEKIVFP